MANQQIALIASDTNERRMFNIEHAARILSAQLKNGRKVWGLPENSKLTFVHGHFIRKHGTIKPDAAGRKNAAAKQQIKDSGSGESGIADTPTHGSSDEPGGGDASAP